MSGNSLGRLKSNSYGFYNYRNDTPGDGRTNSLIWDSEKNQCLLDGVSGNWIATLDTEWQKCVLPAVEFLPSWNFQINPQFVGYRISLKLKSESGEESPWFYLGTGGNFYDKNYGSLIINDDIWGKVNQDYLVSKIPAVEFRIKAELSGVPEFDTQKTSIDNLYLFYSANGNSDAHDTIPDFPSELRIDVPYRSQLDVEKDELKHIVCCPTCVAMVMEYEGVNKPTLDVCQESLDEEHNIYGIWPKASQTAAQNGLSGFVYRFSCDEYVKVCLASGQPLLASIRVKDGELRNSRYPNSNGHLILLIGYDADGNYLVNDPYSVGPNGKDITYFKEDIENVWLNRGGVSVIIHNKGAEQKCLSSLL